MKIKVIMVMVLVLVLLCLSIQSVSAQESLPAPGTEIKVPLDTILYLPNGSTANVQEQDLGLMLVVENTSADYPASEYIAVGMFGREGSPTPVWFVSIADWVQANNVVNPTPTPEVTVSSGDTLPENGEGTGVLDNWESRPTTGTDIVDTVFNNIQWAVEPWLPAWVLLLVLVGIVIRSSLTMHNRLINYGVPENFTERVSFLSEDSIPIIATASLKIVILRIGDAFARFQSLPGEDEDARLGNARLRVQEDLQSALGNEGAKHAANNLNAHLRRQATQISIVKQINSNITNQIGVRVTDCQILGIELPDEVADLLRVGMEANQLVALLIPVMRDLGITDPEVAARTVATLQRERALGNITAGQGVVPFINVGGQGDQS